MIPVVMGNHQQVDVGDVLRRVDVASGKDFIDERQRRGPLAEDRIDQNPVAGKLKIKRGMPHPDHHVLLQIQFAQVCFPGHHGFRRNQTFRRFAEQKTHSRMKLTGFHRLFHRDDRPEAPVVIMGRLLDTGQPFACRRPSEFWALTVKIYAGRKDQHECQYNF